MARRNALLVGFTVVLGAAALMSCSLFEGLGGGGETDTGPAVFNHKIHHVDMGMGCSECHAGASKAAEAGLPALDLCLACHEEPEAGSAIAKAIGTLQDRQKAGAPLWGPEAVSDLTFSHQAHLKGVTYRLASGQQKELACRDCHGEVGTTASLPSATRPPMDLCTDCHERGGVADEKGKPSRAAAALMACATCHETYRADVRPADHRGLWKTAHGERLRFGFDEEASKRCAYCHREDFCTSCHQVEKPKSHTQFFRLRGHGIDASLHRERCLTCHREDVCERCHESTRPQGHGGSWAGAPYRHCSSCHLPLSMTRCTVCHKRADHEIAPLYPRDANHTGNCTMACHTRQHPDPGTGCKTCHK